jgi:hypothetical protein
MEKEVIFEHPNLKLTFYPAESCILETWMGFTEYELFVDLLDKTIAFMVEKSARHLILDVRNHKGLNPKANEHGAKVCVNHAKKYGQMKHAIVVPEYLFSQMSVDNFVRNVNVEKGEELVVNAYFKETDEALAWIRK